MLFKSMLLAFLFLSGVAYADGPAAPPAPSLVPNSTAPRYRAEIPYIASLGPNGVVDVTVVKLDDGSKTELPSVGTHFFIRNKREGTAFMLPEGFVLEFQALVPSGDVFTALRSLEPQNNQAAASQESELRAPAAGKEPQLHSDGNVAGHNPNFTQQPDGSRSPAI